MLILTLGFLAVHQPTRILPLRLFVAAVHLVRVLALLRELHLRELHLLELRLCYQHLRVLTLCIL
jgi:hypothetical protein